MKQPFGATFPDEDVAAMIDYLVKIYGAEASASLRRLAWTILT